ncbi:MAG: hypothetical protein IKU29_08975 [Parabacteroides sp.]|nr:hypothetical protein [Parabacteroides sp.]
MKKYPFETKTLAELIEEAKILLNTRTGELTEEETLEDDADGGYFEDD